MKAIQGWLLQADLNNDTQKEIIIRSTWSGSGCLEDFNIVSWEKDNPIQRLPDEYFPCGTEFAVGGKDSNGNTEVLFEGISDIQYNSVARIQRDFVDTYILSNQIYILKSHEYAPSPYRVYALYDAQQALNKDDIHQAIQLYEQAAHDQTLKDVDSLIFSPNWYVEKWPEDLPEQDHPKEYGPAFALFRLVVLYLHIQEEQKAMSALKELEINYPKGNFGAEFTEAAQLFVEQFERGEKSFVPCQAVSSMIERKYPSLDWHFKWSTWTEADYTNLTLCPYFPASLIR